MEIVWTRKEEIARRGRREKEAESVGGVEGTEKEETNITVGAEGSKTTMGVKTEEMKISEGTEKENTKISEGTETGKVVEGTEREEINTTTVGVEKEGAKITVRVKKEETYITGATEKEETETAMGSEKEGAMIIVGAEKEGIKIAVGVQKEENKIMGVVKEETYITGATEKEETETAMGSEKEGAMIIVGAEKEGIKIGGGYKGAVKAKKEDKAEETVGGDCWEMGKEETTGKVRVIGAEKEETGREKGVMRIRETNWVIKAENEKEIRIPEEKTKMTKTKIEMIKTDDTKTVVTKTKTEADETKPDMNKTASLVGMGYEQEGSRSSDRDTAEGQSLRVTRADIRYQDGRKAESWGKRMTDENERLREKERGKEQQPVSHFLSQSLSPCQEDFSITLLVHLIKRLKYGSNKP